MPFAIIAYANFYQFAAKEKVSHPRVESRMFLWCRHGRGAVTVNGMRCEFAPGDFLLMPWNHAVLYEADPREPFFVGGIHLIPFQARGAAAPFMVSHRPDGPLAGLKCRRDCPAPLPPGLARGTLQEGRLAWLTSYVVDFFQNVGPDEPTLRMLAQLLVRELVLATQAGRPSASPLPAALQRMAEYARRHLAHPLTVADLAAVGECSAASVHRQFQAFLDTTPHRFIAGLRIEQAKHLLRSSPLPIGRLAPQVGFDDPFHFSRFYKKHTGLSPRAYRQRASIL